LISKNADRNWSENFKQHDILCIFWSAKATAAAFEGKKLSGYMEDSKYIRS
jgi:hypothetical protein